MTNGFWFSIGWVIAASLLGFGISALFSGWLKLSRRVFLMGQNRGWRPGIGSQLTGYPCLPSGLPGVP
jgi:hypothetical protein